MLKLVNTVGAVLTTDQEIPLNVKFNTNNKISFINNKIIMNKGGFYKIDGNFELLNTGTSATTVSVQLFADETPITEAIATKSLAASGQDNFIINDLERILPQFNVEKVKLTFRVSGGVSLVNANVGIFEIK